MRKILIFTAALLMISGNAALASEMDNKNICESFVSTSREVSVTMIKSNGRLDIVNRSKKGIYDPEANTLTVDGRTYTVQENKSTKGERQYYNKVAGGIYYFNA